MASFNNSFSSGIQNTVIVTDFDLGYMPQVKKNLINRFPMQWELGWIKEFGMMEETKGQTYYWLENNLAYEAPIIQSISNPSGNLALITLAPASHQSSGKYSFPRKKETIMLMNLREGLIVDKNESVAGAHTITVRPKTNITYAQFVAGITAGQQFFISGSAGAEGGRGMEQSIIPTFSVASNKIQKVIEKFSVTPEDMTNETWGEFTNPETGEKGRFLYLKGLGDTAKYFANKQEMVLFVGNLSDSSLTEDVTGGRVVSTTEGLIPTLDQRGTQMTWSAPLTVSFYEEVCRRARKNHSCKTFAQLHGQNFGFAAQNFLKDYLPNGAIVYANPASDNEIEINFSSFSYNGYTFKFKELNILSHEQLAGTPGFDYKDRAIFMPMDKKVIKIPQGETKEAYSFTKMYKKQPPHAQVSRGDYAVGTLGFYGDIAPTSDQFVYETHYVCDIGARVAGAKEFINVRRAF